MRALRNQYSDIITEYYFNEYRTTKSEDIITEVLQLIRNNGNEFPVNEMVEEYEQEIISRLEDITLGSVYSSSDKTIYPNSAGIELINHVYQNIYDVRRVENGKEIPSMREGFNNDKILRNALKLCLQYDANISQLRRQLSLAGCGYTNSFRPTAAKALYQVVSRELGRELDVYDYSTGYGGRLMGAWSSDCVSSYVGVDPNDVTNTNTKELIRILNKYRSSMVSEIYTDMSESFIKDGFRFDFAFSSPPYFNKEIYSNDISQSYNNFTVYREWMMRYLRKTVHNSIRMLRREGIFGINVSEDMPYIKEFLIKVCSELEFELWQELRMVINTRPGINSDDIPRRVSRDEKTEPIWLFKKRG